MKYVEYNIDGGTWKVPDAFYRISIKLIIKNNSDELLVMRALKDSLYELPGGGLEWGETVEQAAARELAEELNLTLTHIETKPLVTEYSQHPFGFHAIKMYYTVSCSGTAIDNEPDLFTHSWVAQKEFTALHMPSDESPIQKHKKLIWPRNS